MRFRVSTNDFDFTFTETTADSLLTCENFILAGLLLSIVPVDFTCTYGYLSFAITLLIGTFFTWSGERLAVLLVDCKSI